MTCVGTPSGHPDHDRSMYVVAVGSQSTAGLTMLTTALIVPSRTLFGGYKNI